MKILYFDVETTGLDSNMHDITQLAGAVEIDGVIVERFNFDVKPFNLDNVSQTALDITNKTLDEIAKYQDPRDVFRKFFAILNKYVDRFDSSDKFYPAGYNVTFDIGFLKEFFLKNGDKYYGSWFSHKALDPLPILYMMDSVGKLRLANYKLGTVCEALDIVIEAHDADSDINATIQVFDFVRANIK